MSNPLFNIRGATPQDANALLDIDIKCFDEPWTAEEWSRIGHSKDYAISVVTFFGTVIGFGVFRMDPDNIRATEILKVAVLKPHRRKHASLYLIAAAVSFGESNFSKEIFTIIPEHLIYPGPECISEWLLLVGLKAQKPFLKCHFNSTYGEAENGVKFSGPLQAKAAA